VEGETCLDANRRQEVSLKLEKAEEFLLAAQLMEEEVQAHDAATSLAVSAAINASDAIILAYGRSYPRSTDHNRAVTILRNVAGSSSSRQLANALALKNRAQYDLSRCSPANARTAISAAERLITNGRSLLG
jgi:uncharacterized protein (UPF0332 family)